MSSIQKNLTKSSGDHQAKRRKEGKTQKPTRNPNPQRKKVEATNQK
jgi:hypothetical protein